MKQNILRWLLKYRIHILIWVLYIIYEITGIGLISGIYGEFPTYLAHYTLIIFLFYFHAELAFPWALKNSHTTIYKLPLIIITEFLGYILISFVMDRFLISFHFIASSKPLIISWPYILKALMRSFYFMCFASGYYFIRSDSEQKRKNHDLEKQRLVDVLDRQNIEHELIKTQNAFLKAQINPHLLNNVLDFIYQKIKVLVPDTADAVLKLTEMLRYAVDSDKMGEYICLRDELEQLENLLYLSNIRNKQQLNILLEYDEEILDLNLIPMALLTFAENIIKHGDLSDSKDQAYIRIGLRGSTFFIETKNPIDHGLKLGVSGKGLHNIKKRLQYAYGNEVIFTYGINQTGHFTLLLNIPVEMLAKHDAPPLSFLKDKGIELPRGFADQHRKAD